MLDELIMATRGWNQLTLSRILTLALSLYVLISVMNRARLKRVSLLGGIFWLVVGLGGVLVTAFPQIIYEMQQVDFEMRTRLGAGLLSAVVLLVTFENVRCNRMQERYALLWVFTSIFIFICASNPGFAGVLIRVTGLEYSQSIIAVLFTFLVLVAFHFSLALSDAKDSNSRLVQRLSTVEARLEALERKVSPAEPEAADEQARSISSALKKVWAEDAVDRRFFGRDAWKLILFLGIAATLMIGLLAPGPMIGDEVTHYYMLVDNADSLPAGSYEAPIPVPWNEGGFETRNYPHANLWHYTGAIWHSILGGQAWSVQIFQVLFLLQLILAGLAFVRGGGPVQAERDALLALTLLSVPAVLLFSVAFYLDVPAAAQVLTGLALLRRKHWLLGAVFIGLGCMIKETMLLMVPGFLFCTYIWNGSGWKVTRSRCVQVLGCAVIVMMMCAISSASLKNHGYRYYPYAKFRVFYNQVVEKKDASSKFRVGKDGEKKPKATKMPVISTHPGDLRRPVNFVVYGGGVSWIVLAGALGLGCLRRKKTVAGEDPEPVVTDSRALVGMLVTSGIFILASAWLLKTAPDARFFLPGLILLLCAAVMVLSRTRWPRPLLLLFTLVCVMQSVGVLGKVYALRHVSPGIREAITVLEDETFTEEADRIFMYPEGNYRLFPQLPVWYLHYQLKDFWRGDNDERLRILKSCDIGALVIKKHLIAPIDEKMHNLSVYPPEFVRDIRQDARFVKLLENDAVLVFRVSYPATVEPEGDTEPDS